MIKRNLGEQLLSHYPFCPETKELKHIFKPNTVEDRLIWINPLYCFLYKGVSEDILRNGKHIPINDEPTKHQLQVNI